MNRVREKFKVLIKLPLGVTIGLLHYMMVEQGAIGLQRFLNGEDFNKEEKTEKLQFLANGIFLKKANMECIQEDILVEINQDSVEYNLGHLRRQNQRAYQVWITPCTWVQLLGNQHR